MPRQVPEVDPALLADRLEYDPNAAPPAKRPLWRRLIWWLGIPLAVILASSAFSVFYLRNRSSVVSVDTTVEHYRQSGGSSSSARTDIPAPGVYVYDTTGTESINALGGSKHTYPAETTITVTPTSCGYLSRWTALSQRWDEYELCAIDGDQEVKRISIYHNFFLKSDLRDYLCKEGALYLPPSTEPGTTWTGRCATPDAFSIQDGRVVGLETIQIAGTSVDSIHVVLESTLSGSTQGTRHQDLWYAPTGLLYRTKVTVDTDADSPFGRVHYVERYGLTLTSLDPRV